MAGKEPLRGVLGEWDGPDDNEWRRNGGPLTRLFMHSNVGYGLATPDLITDLGPETGAAGKAAADASVVDRYWLDGGPFKAPTP